MSRYYFHIRNGEALVCDDEGMECRDLGAVQDEARSSIIDLLRAALIAGTCAASIEVEDECGKPVFRLIPKRLLN